jgi:Tfp pilus assembly protein PilF
MALTGAVSAALQRGDLLSAGNAMELASPAQRKTFQYLIYRAILAVRRGDYGDARKACEEAASHRQESPTMHAYLGFLDLRESQPDAARRHFERALAIATTPMDALSDIVDLCASNGFASQVRSYAERLRDLATAAIANDPGSPSLYSTRALAYSALGEQVLASRDVDSNRGLTGWWQGLGPSAGEDLPAGRQAGRAPAQRARVR